MSTFWTAIGVLAATVAVLAGLAAFRFRSAASLERHAVPVRPGLFAQAAAEGAAETGLPAAFRFDGASGRFIPIDDESATALGPVVSTPAGESGAERALRADEGAVEDRLLQAGGRSPGDPGGMPPRAEREPEHAGEGEPGAAPGVSGEDDGRRRPSLRGVVRMPRTAGGRRLLVVAVTGVSALAGLAVAGPVGTLVAVYCRLGVRGLMRREAARSTARARTRTLDMLCALAADLRAGLPHTDPPVLPDPRIGRLTTAAWRLAERTGAPVADLVERIESDTRAMARGQAAAAAEAAGARATAWLLAALPAGGLVLGAFMGVDPLHVLLHTPIGAACATGAVILQSAGLAWANRLATSGSTP